MKLYTRLVLSYGYLVTLVLVGAVGGAFGFHALGSRIGAVLADNFESVRASMMMVEALERQDSAVLQALLRRDGAREDVDRSEKRFYEALDRAGANVTEDREHDLLRSIADAYDEYRKARDGLLDVPLERPLARYEAECFPQFEAVKVAVRDLLDVNHEAMVDADREAQAAAAERAIGYGGLTALALVSMGVLSRGLRRHVVVPLEELRAVAEAVEGGDLRRRVSESSGGELGQVARELNRLLDEHQEARGRFQARRSGLREILVALVRARGAGSALVSLNGEVVVSTLDDATTAAIAAEAERLREELEAAEDVREPFARTLAIDGEPHSARLLLAEGGRPLAWLVGEGRAAGSG